MTLYWFTTIESIYEGLNKTLRDEGRQIAAAVNGVTSLLIAIKIHLENVNKKGTYVRTLKSRRVIVIWRNHLCTFLESMLLYPPYIFHGGIKPTWKILVVLYKLNSNFLISDGIVYWHFHENSPLFSLNHLISLNISAVSKTVSFTVALFLTSSLEILGNVLKKILALAAATGQRSWSNIDRTSQNFFSQKRRRTLKHTQEIFIVKKQKNGWKWPWHFDSN